MKARYVHRITPADVGRRVSVRSRLDDAVGGPSLTDVVGRLVAWEGTSLVVERRDGRQVTLDAERIVASRVIG